MNWQCNLLQLPLWQSAGLRCPCYRCYGQLPTACVVIQPESGGASPPESNHKGVKRREMVVQELPARFGFIADEMEQVLPEVTRITQAMTSVSHSASMHCMMRSVCAPRQTAPNTLERGLCTWTCWQFLPVLCRTVAVG